MLKQLIPAVRLTLALTVLTSLLYPGVVTALSQLLFRQQANGSLIVKDGRVVGSALVGQNFTKPEYFHPRPSAAGSDGYDASASSGSNLGPASKKLADRVNADIARFRSENPDYHGPIPADLVTASGSGLDPHISPGSARAQAPRVAKARGIAAERMEQLIAQSTEQPGLGLLGERRVNVLKLNLTLDGQFPR